VPGHTRCGLENSPTYLQFGRQWLLVQTLLLSWSLKEESILRGKPDKEKVPRSTKQEVEWSLAMSQKRDTLPILMLIAGKHCAGDSQVSIRTCPQETAAALVLLGGFVLRLVIVFAAEGV